MLMSVIARHCETVALPELAGARILITGLTSSFGFDIARSFADRGARLILQSPEESPEMTELAAVLAESPADIRLYNMPLDSEEEAARLVQSVAQEVGGLDAVINLALVEAEAMGRLETSADVEALISDTLRLPLRLTEVAANRMRLVWVEGSILNVVRVEDTAGGRAMMLADVMRAELAALTRGMATQWANDGIRINAVAPPSSIATMSGDVQASDTDLAKVALELASHKGRSVSGHILDAAGAARTWC